MSYTEVFGGANIYPSEISYSAVALTVDVTLSWPEEALTNENLATRIIDVTPASAGLSILLPSAVKSGVGNTILFNNRGAYTFTVKDYDGVQVVSIDSSTLWQVYLTDNSTEAGVWGTLQYGATTSIADASALAGTGIVAIGTQLSQSMPITTFNSSYTAGMTDRAKMFNWTGAAGTLTLPTPTTVGNNWFVYLRNSGTGTIVADAPGSSLINGSSIVNFQPGSSAVIACDGAGFYTVGLGQSATFAFNYTVIDVAGTGDYVLSGSELNSISYKFTGVLTGDRYVIVPDTVQQYWVDNETAGVFTLEVKTLAGTGIAVNTGERSIMYCDGTDVLDADTAGVSFPIVVSQGGTGAITASGARINLGGTSVGVAVFTAVSDSVARTALGSTTVGGAIFTAANQQAAWTALGVAPAGVVDGGSF